MTPERWFDARPARLGHVPVRRETGADGDERGRRVAARAAQHRRRRRSTSGCPGALGLVVRRAARHRRRAARARGRPLTTHRRRADPWLAAQLRQTSLEAVARSARRRATSQARTRGASGGRRQSMPGALGGQRGEARARPAVASRRWCGHDADGVAERAGPVERRPSPRTGADRPRRPPRGAATPWTSRRSGRARRPGRTRPAPRRPRASSSPSDTKARTSRVLPSSGASATPAASTWSTRTAGQAARTRAFQAASSRAPTKPPSSARADADGGRVERERRSRAPSGWPAPSGRASAACAAPSRSSGPAARRRPGRRTAARPVFSSRS